jgi:urease subunit alpha
MAAENAMHDMGVISMISSDSQAMGRVGESFLRIFQLANQMKAVRGRLPEDAPDNDNFRVLRYLAKMTINPAITVGIADVLGSIAPGKMADLVLWEPGFFAAKPKYVIKGGLISWAPAGVSDASLPLTQPVRFKPMFGAFGTALHETCVTFMSQAGIDAGVPERHGLRRKIKPIKNTRTLTKRDMVRNSATPRIEVNPETFAVKVDGEHATVPPASRLALNQLYFFS